MALPLVNTLKSVDDKIAQLADIHSRLRLQIAALEEENENLRRDLAEARAQIKIEKTNVEFLTMSHRLADSPDSIISARRRITRLIRTIDNCISMLKEE